MTKQASNGSSTGTPLPVPAISRAAGLVFWCLCIGLTAGYAVGHARALRVFASWSATLAAALLSG